MKLFKVQNIKNKFQPSILLLRKYWFQFCVVVILLFIAIKANDTANYAKSFNRNLEILDFSVDLSDLESDISEAVDNSRQAADNSREALDSVRETEISASDASKNAEEATRQAKNAYDEASRCATATDLLIYCN